MTTAEGQILVLGGDSTNSGGPAVDGYGSMPANLLSYQNFWKFDNSGADLVNPACTASGGAYTLQTGPTSGRVLNALLLNVTHVSLPQPSCGDIGAGDFSIEFWVKPSTSSAGVESILDKRALTASGYHGYQVFLYKNEIGLQMDSGSYMNYGSYIAVPANGNQWTHIAITVARQTNVGTIRHPRS